MSIQKYFKQEYERITHTEMPETINRFIDRLIEITNTIKESKTQEEIATNTKKLVEFLSDNRALLENDKRFSTIIGWPTIQQYFFDRLLYYSRYRTNY